MLRLLLVHENPSVHLLIRQELSNIFPDLQVEVVMSASALQTALSQGLFDLVIVDAGLAWSDGITVLKQVKHCDPALPVLMFTHCRDAAVAVAAMKAGLDDYLIAPEAGVEDLAAAIRARLNRRAAPFHLRSHTALEALIHSAPLAITVLDRWGTVQVWNPSAERIFGWSAAEALGQPMPTVPQEKQSEFQANIQITLRGQPLTGQETQRRRKDGTLISVQIWTAVLHNPQGEPDQLMSIVADITERKQAEAERDRALAREQTARTQAEAANRLKDEFLAMLSHELRSPLNSVLGWSQLLQTRKFNEATTQRALETIERNARAQTQLVEDLLDMSKIVQGKLCLNIRPVQLNSLIETAIETACPAAAAKEIQLVSRLMPLGPVAGDGDRLYQVIWNLLTNAIKFTPVGGRVEVELGLAAVTAEASEPPGPLRRGGPLQVVQLTVRDTGQGIGPEFLPYVFDRFRQADSKTTRLHGGLGLGLAIVRHLVELHGGTVNASSPGEGQGATFQINLPIGHSATPAIRYSTDVSLPSG